MKISYLSGSILPAGTLLIISSFSGVTETVIGTAEVLKKIAPEDAVIEIDNVKIARVYHEIGLWIDKKRRKRDQFYRRYARRGEKERMRRLR